MGIYSDLSCDKVWNEYLEYKLERRHLTKSEEQDLKKYISGREYVPVLKRLSEGGSFSVPEKKLIRKMHTDKKRTVYLFPREENYLLKLLTFLLLRKYDDIFADSLYSFRIHTGVNKAMKKILASPRLKQKCSYKVDISNYFNSIPVDRMLERLKPVLTDEPEVFSMFEKILNEPKVLDEGQVITEQKGVMAGTPFAVFLANVYLMDLDRECLNQGYMYARYSDDIIIFADSESERDAGAEFIRKSLSDNGLVINPKKEVYTSLGEPWAFLGIGYDNGKVDISEVSKDKIKAKMRRRARAIKRWQVRKRATPEQAVKAFIRAMNRKFFDPDSSHELTWSRWYFPIITTDDTLHEIDSYMQYWIRYLATGTHNKSAYRFEYGQMKNLGYISLVHEWYANWCSNKSEVKNEG